MKSSLDPSHGSNHDTKMAFDAKIAAAKQVIHLLQDLDQLDNEQLALLCSAHYTLAEQYSISINRAKMHINSAITLSQNIKNKDINAYLQLAYSYSRRAEIYELENNGYLAISDYQRALDIFAALKSEFFGCQLEFLDNHIDDKIDQKTIEDMIMHMAHCAITIADLLLNDDTENAQLQQQLTLPRQASQLNQTSQSPQSIKSQPLYFVNLALEYLAKLPRTNEDLWATLAYVHTVAGFALSAIDIEEAIEAYRTALTMAFKADARSACQILGDIYVGLGQLYEQYHAAAPIQKIPACAHEHSEIYYQIALFFNPIDSRDNRIPVPNSIDDDNVELSEDDSLSSGHNDHDDSEYQEDAAAILNLLFDRVYRALDPYLPPLSQTVVRDFIDALIFGYYCIADGILPNQILGRKLKQTDIYNSYAQHIYWLVVEAFHREQPNHRLIELANPEAVDVTLDIANILKSILNSGQNKAYSNVFHLPRPAKTLSTV